jgi:hypothetical protein
VMQPRSSWPSQSLTAARLASTSWQYASALHGTVRRCAKHRQVRSMICPSER